MMRMNECHLFAGSVYIGMIAKGTDLEVEMMVKVMK